MAFIDASITHLRMDYKAKSRRGEIVRDLWTGQPMMVPQDYQRLRIQPMKQIVWKLMLYPEPCSTNPWYYLVIIDPNPSIDLESRTEG